MGMDWGGFATGLKSGSELFLRAQESKLKTKMLEHQMDVQKFEQQERQRKAGDEAQQAVELGKLAEMVGSGVPGQPPAPLEPGQEGPTPDRWFQVPNRPATQGEIFGQSLRSVPASSRAGLIQQSMKPSAAMTRPVKPGDYVPDPTDPSGYKQIGTPTKTAATEDRALTESEIVQLFPDMPEPTRKAIASLPQKAQARTIDDARAQAGQKQAASQFQQGQQSLDERALRGQERADVRETERERQRQERIQLEEDRRATPPLSGKESTDLTNVRSGLTDIRRVKQILAKAKGKFTGPIDTRTMDLKNVFNLAPKEYNELTSILGKLRNEVRHEKFGAALTGLEIKEALREMVEERQNDAKVRERIDYLEKQFERTEQGLSSREQFWKQRRGSIPGAPSTSKPITAEIATQFLRQSGGDKEKARALARDQGYKF